LASGFYGATELIALLAELFASAVDVLVGLIACLPRLLAQAIRSIAG
jgi:hypothetical protein